MTSPRLSRKARISAAIVLIFLFAALAILVTSGRTSQFDDAVRATALSVNTPSLVEIWRDISFLGSVSVIYGISLLAFLGLAAMSRLSEGKWFLVLMLGAAVIEPAAKWLVHRPRPAEAYPDTLPETFSFPSGHTFFSLVFYLSAAILLARRSTPFAGWMFITFALLLAGIIGLSRIFLGVHYFTDVLAGSIAGSAWVSCLSLALPELPFETPPPDDTAH